MQIHKLVDIPEAEALIFQLFQQFSLHCRQLCNSLKLLLLDSSQPRLLLPLVPPVSCRHRPQSHFHSYNAEVQLVKDYNGDIQR